MSCSICPHSKEQLTVEDSQNDLRQLEHNALEAVLHAFRAQGPLDLYKEVLLDHLRTCLFISSEDYIFKVDHVATDPSLKSICDTLNPSYAFTNANWLLERQTVFPADYRLHMDRLGNDVTDIFDPTRISDENWTRMYQEHEERQKSSLAKLLTLKKEPFTPELLREILVRTEQSKRIDCKTTGASTQTYDNDAETSQPLLVRHVDVETQTIEQVNVQDTEEATTSAKIEQQDESIPEPMDTSNERCSSESSTPALNSPELLSTFISNISELGSFNKFIRTKLSTLKPPRKQNIRKISLKSRYNLLRHASQQPETQVNYLTNERSHSLS